jgi:hypothetical protein
MASDAWQQRVDDLWASFDDHDEDAFVATPTAPRGTAGRSTSGSTACPPAGP